MFPETTTTGTVREVGDLDVTVKAIRSVRIEAEVVSGSGETNHVIFEQHLSYSNVQEYKQNATVQVRLENGY